MYEIMACCQTTMTIEYEGKNLLSSQLTEKSKGLQVFFSIQAKYHAGIYVDSTVMSQAKGCVTSELRMSD